MVDEHAEEDQREDDHDVDKVDDVRDRLHHIFYIEQRHPIIVELVVVVDIEESLEGGHDVLPDG